jgi:hypothetical protein
MSGSNKSCVADKHVGAKKASGSKHVRHLSPMETNLAPPGAPGSRELAARCRLRLRTGPQTPHPAAIATSARNGASF